MDFSEPGHGPAPGADKAPLFPSPGPAACFALNASYELGTPRIWNNSSSCGLIGMSSSSPAGEPPLEPGVVEPDDLAALGHAAEGALDDGGEIGVVAAIHEAVRVVGQIFADDFVPLHAVRLGDQPIEQHIVGPAKRLDLARLEQGEGGGVIRGADDLDAELLLVAETPAAPPRWWCRRSRPPTCRPVAVAMPIGEPLLHRQLGAGDEDHRREGHLLLPLAGCWWSSRIRGRSRRLHSRAKRFSAVTVLYDRDLDRPELVREPRRRPRCRGRSSSRSARPPG